MPIAPSGWQVLIRHDGQDLQAGIPDRWLPRPVSLLRVRPLTTASRPALGITGALVYLDGRWAQILEGHSAAITGLYHRIARDPRHDHIIFDYLIETEGRLFPDWSMGRITDDDKADMPLARILAAVTAADADTHIRQLRSLVRTAREDR